jgi:poly-gamma-glutamate synthesis protein (capsule biosynthesis protein)
MDWGHKGLEETLDALKDNGIRTAGAGRNAKEAEEPAIIELEGGKTRILAYSWADESSGVPEEWAAGEQRGGVNFLADGISAKSAEAICRRIQKVGKGGRISGIL